MSTSRSKQHQPGSAGSTVRLATRVRKDRMTPAEISERNKKIREDKEANKQKEWVESMAGRNYICERQVDEDSLRGAFYIDIIKREGMHHFFVKVDGFHRDWVSSFYKNMMIDEVQEEIHSVVENRQILVTPDIIAEYLGYVRPMNREIPEVVTFPRPDNELANDVIKAGVYVDKDNVEGLISFKEGYNLMNKVLHYNLYPRGDEKTPGIGELEFLYVFMTGDEVVDYAQWIFDQMVELKTIFKRGVSFPFPAMVTALCIRQGRFRVDIKKLDSGLGPFTATTEARSEAALKSASRRRTLRQAPPATEQIGTQAGGAGTSTSAPPPTSAPTPPAPKTGNGLMTLLKSCLCRQVEIQTDQKRIDHKVSFCADRLGELTERRYEPPQGEWGDRAIGEHRSPPREEDDEWMQRPGESEEEFLDRLTRSAD